MQQGGLFAGLGAIDASRLGEGGEVVVKWLGAGVGTVGAGQAPLGDGVDVASEDGSADRVGDVDAPRCLTIKAAVGTEDRKGDVIAPDGWELEGYRSNPVFLWAHDRSIPPIGQAKRVWIEDGSLQAVVEFAPTDFATEVAELYVRGFMRGVSVGFIPLEMEIREASNGRRGYLYRRHELLEISAVPVPMHTDALVAKVREPDSVATRTAAQSSDLADQLRSLWTQVGRVVV